ncbi:hypothetical protein ACLOJK_017876 [Asimina triloba]
MADADAKQQTETTQDQTQRLKYLDFVQVAAIHAIVFFSSIYDFAKENSGPLKPGVQTVEGTVKNVIGPVYEKFHVVPLQLLRFADRKGRLYRTRTFLLFGCVLPLKGFFGCDRESPATVDGFLNEVERHVPSLLKTASSRAVMVAHMAPEMARSVASEVQRAGVMETATELARRTYVKVEPSVKKLYMSYEPVAEQCAVWGWRKLNRLPLFPEVAHILVPTAAYWSDKYNQAVSYTVERRYAFSSYLPLIPKERISKVFSGKGAGAEEASSQREGDDAALAPSGEAVTATVGGQ